MSAAAPTGKDSKQAAGLAKAEYISLVAGGLSTASVLAQLTRTLVAYTSKDVVGGLSTTFLILSLAGAVLWLYWAVDLYMATSGSRGLFSIIYGAITIAALIVLLLLRTKFFTVY
eukprot:CAMPEP_0198666766 /NCGR_PEP_ID=MMETSP1467-20131203/65988_1 /TAXON_ID=1462469 /ORGANISM="unid. sp., Strain CCMP2135" /LENGTH=114 /DNA_ID=CAMNT_0044403433 /DNA_START=248 /DNA_END=592 /DNA_ORIENTATION=+